MKDNTQEFVSAALISLIKKSAAQAGLDVKVTFTKKAVRTTLTAKNGVSRTFATLDSASVFVQGVCFALTNLNNPF